MRRYTFFLSIVALAMISGAGPAAAQCALPYQLTNGQTADSTQVMANFNALVGCSVLKAQRIRFSTTPEAEDSPALGR